MSFYCGTSLKKVFHRVREGGAPECRCRPEEEEEEDEVVVEKDEEGEGQRGTTKEEDHVILLWYTSSSVPGSDVPLTRHTLQLASLQDPEEWVCLSYGSDRASLAVYNSRIYRAHTKCLLRHEIRARPAADIGEYASFSLSLDLPHNRTRK